MIEGVVPAADRGTFQTLWRTAFRRAGFPEEWANNAFDVGLSDDGQEPADIYYFRMPMQRSMLFEAMTLVAQRVGRQSPVERGENPDEIPNKQSVRDFLQFLRNRGILVRIRRNDLGENAPEIKTVETLLGKKLVEVSLSEPL